MINLISSFILLSCILSFNLYSAMTAVPIPRYKKTADHNIPGFNKKHGKFLYYPLLQKDTKFSLIDFNRKYDEILHKNIDTLLHKRANQSAIDKYKAAVLIKHYTHIANITFHSMNSGLPLREISTNQEMNSFPPFNNVCFYYYPIPTQDHVLDRTKYEKTFRNTLQLNLGTARTRGIDQPHLDAYAAKVLAKLKNTLALQFPRTQNVIQTFFHQNIYVLDYYIRMEITLKQLESLGLSHIEILRYRQNMLEQLNNTTVQYRQHF